jgi:Mor family transcriptional regulator
MARKGEDKLYAFVDDLVNLGTRRMVDMLDLEEESARTLMRVVAHDICVQYARSNMYVPLDMEFELSQRDKDLWAQYGEDSATARKFTPDRVAELAEAYRITTVQCYCILRLMRTREQAARRRDFEERQGVLALPTPDEDAAANARAEED